MPELSKDELWKIYDLLPDDLKDAIFAQGTADNISLACSMAQVDDERVSKVAKITGQVLMGLVAPEEFQAALIKEAELSEPEAKKVTHQIQRLVFNPVKESLALLYGQKGEAAPKAGAAAAPEEEIEGAQAQTQSVKKAPGRKSRYLEPIEEQPAE